MVNASLGVQIVFVLTRSSSQRSRIPDNYQNCMTTADSDSAAFTRGSSQSNDLSPTSHSGGKPSQSPHPEGPEPALLQQAHDYGYSNSDPLSSMGMFKKVLHNRFSHKNFHVS